MKADIYGKTIKLPDFLIVGANKGGTTSLYYYLKQHPQIFMPLLKEPNFFLFGGEPPPPQPFPDKKKMERIWRFDDYVSLFEGAGEGQILGEASTPYLTGNKKAIPNIKKFVPGWEGLKIIMVLRDPAARAFSQYMMYRLWGVEKLEFEDAIREYKDLRGRETNVPRYIGPGYYYEQVKAYMDNFSHIKVHLFDDLKADTPKVVKETFRFLGVDESFVSATGTRFNPSGKPKSEFIDKLLSTPSVISSKLPLFKKISLQTRIELTEKLRGLNLQKKERLKEDTRQYLINLYRQDVLKLQELIGRDLSGWLK
ncbi:MAG: sulfotransferase domain-containing protein [Nitrospirota bacterium]|jgi:hypothetical protein